MSAPIVKLCTQPNCAWTDIRQEQGLPNSAGVWGVGLLVLVIGRRFNVLTPEYLRATVG